MLLKIPDKFKFIFIHVISNYSKLDEYLFERELSYL